MNEIQRIEKLFTALFDGDPWIESSLLVTLENLSAEKAARKPASVANSIWEIANHIINWREVILKRIQGEKFPTPEHNYFVPVEDTSPEAWKAALLELKLRNNFGCLNLPK
jgi:uncharacterized damage-inducible protein DinB